MNDTRAITIGAAVLTLALLHGAPVATSQEAAIGAKAAESGVSQRASGTFDVKVAPVADTEGSIASSRLSIGKTFHGDLEGTSRGEMWTAATSVEGSAGYVAIERIEGRLRGRQGTFTLLHQGTMRHGGDFKLTLVTVPDSGTGQLAGLAGTMTIAIADGRHSYTLDYTLPDAR